MLDSVLPIGRQLKEGMMIRKLYWKIKCSLNKHRLYETVANLGTGWPSTGYACYECHRKWDWDGNERLNDGTGY